MVPNGALLSSQCKGCKNFFFGRGGGVILDCKSLFQIKVSHVQSILVEWQLKQNTFTDFWIILLAKLFHCQNSDADWTQNDFYCFYASILYL